MNPNRIRLIRLAHALSLQDLSDQLKKNYGLSCHRSAIFGYENGRTSPPADFLDILAKDMGVSTAFFDLEDWDSFHIDFFHLPSVTKQRATETDAFIQIKLERCRELDRLLGITSTWRVPEKLVLDRYDPQSVEDLVTRLQQEWNIGTNPITSVCGLLESIGWYLLMTPNNLERVELNNTEVCGFETSAAMPFIMYSPTAYADEIRYKLLQLVGYAYVQGPDDETTEQLVKHFSRALLFSQDRLIEDVGSRRTAISEDELSMLKNKYGLPRRQIMLRLRDLGIISEQTYRSFKTYLQQNLFLKREGFMGQSWFYETPVSYDLKLKRAQSEKLLSPDLRSFFE